MKLKNTLLPRLFLPAAITAPLIGLTPTQGYASDAGAPGANRIELDGKRWEFRLFSGYDQISSTPLETRFDGGSESGEIDFGAGYSVGGSLSFNLLSDLFFEVSYTYRSAGEADAPADLFGEKAEVDVASVTISPTLWYRPPIELLPGLTPRVGVGYGWLQEVSLDATIGSEEESFDGDGSALLLLAGLDWALGENWLLGFDVRYLHGGNIDATSEDGGGRDLSFDYNGFSANLSVGYRF